ncbi:MAG: carboxypeptidase regulatory-like domain-containing protein [Acidobacteria bacterium]|nr:carboxypeptidase regulatory-like domain-containing protein [Acidobacteriota bacterium]
MRRSASYALSTWLLISAFAVFALAQAPVGTISGTVSDQSGAVIRNAAITIKNKATGIERQIKSDEDGNFSAAALPAGEYELKAIATGFRTILQEVTVATGAIAKVELRMEVGQQTEIVTIEGGGSNQLNYEGHSIDGVITRQKIQELPLNGRSFLQLAFLEPGVSASPGTTAQYNSLFSVSILGGDSARTAITVDGGNVRNSIEGNTGMNFSQEVVQEFQLSSTNFDLSTGITSVGAVNIVTRTGGNQFHGSGYFFFRDHNMSAYPGLKRICQEPSAPALCNNTAERKAIEDPFFARRNPGFWVGGPILKDRLFFFTNYEYTNQTSVVTYQPNYAAANSLAGNFASPYSGHLFSTRFDWKVTDKHNAFLRYSHDQNKGFGPNGGAVLPSNWLQNKNFSDQGVVGITSTFTPSIVNDFRFNYTYWQNRNLFPDSSVCPDCVGLNFPQLQINGTNVTVGNTSNATQGRDLRRFTFLDTLTWQKGSHRMRFGTEIEYAPGTGFWGYCDPACTVGFSPDFINQTIKPLLPPAQFAALFPTLPSTIKTGQDLLNLPFAGAIVGVGDPSQPPPYNVDKAKINKRLRFYGQDTWKLKPNFTLNYGLAWNFESTLVNRDLDKPKYLTPLYGSDLSPTHNNYDNFSPALGFAWNLGKDNKTVVRGGAGIYWDTEQLWRRLEERGYIGPLGNGRQQVPHTAFTNIFPGIINFNTLQPVAVGAPLPASGQLTNLTVGQFMQIYNAQIAAVTSRLSTTNFDLAVRGIQVGKTGSNLYPLDYPVQRSYHMNIGFQRDLGHDMVVNVDFVRRVFVNTLLGALDYNRYNRYINGVQTPVIPKCTTAAQIADVNAQCSTGSITFWTPAGRQVYNGLLVKLDKRFSKRYLFTASYALTNIHGYNGISNLDKWNATWGPQGGRHSLNISGLIELPWGFQIGLISQMGSRGPLMPSINSVDLDGDGSGSTPIPGVDYNCFNRGCGKDDLAAAVANWNTTYAGKKDALGRTIAAITLPANYEFGDWFSSQDVRVTKKFVLRDRYTFAIFGEVFNVFNVANLGGYSFNLSNSANFGQPTSRAGQVFGSGGPRAIQLGGRFTF